MFSSNCQELYTDGIIVIKKCEGCRRRIVVRDRKGEENKTGNGLWDR